MTIIWLPARRKVAWRLEFDILVFFEMANSAWCRAVVVAAAEPFNKRDSNGKSVMRAVPRAKIFLVGTLCLTLSLGTLATLAVAAGDDAEPKHTVKEVMKVAHKDGLLKKILNGDGSAEDKQMLLDLYVSLIENKPKKGSMESWQTLAGGAALAAAKVVVGREDGIAQLKKASNCKACHDVHK